MKRWSSGGRTSIRTDGPIVIGLYECLVGVVPTHCWIANSSNSTGGFINKIALQNIEETTVLGSLEPEMGRLDGQNIYIVGL